MVHLDNATVSRLIIKLVCEVVNYNIIAVFEIAVFIVYNNSSVKDDIEISITLL